MRPLGDRVLPAPGREVHQGEQVRGPRPVEDVVAGVRGPGSGTDRQDRVRERRVAVEPEQVAEIRRAATPAWAYARAAPR